MKNENIMIKANIRIQHIQLTDFAIVRMYRTNYVTFSIKILNLKVKNLFLGTLSPPSRSILKGRFT